jgi:hypothetical protein
VCTWGGPWGVAVVLTSQKKDYGIDGQQGSGLRYNFAKATSRCMHVGPAVTARDASPTHVWTCLPLRCVCVLVVEDAFQKVTTPTIQPEKTKKIQNLRPKRTKINIKQQKAKQTKNKRTLCMLNISMPSTNKHENLCELVC